MPSYVKVNKDAEEKSITIENLCIKCLKNDSACKQVRVTIFRKWEFTFSLDFFTFWVALDIFYFFRSQEGGGCLFPFSGLFGPRTFQLFDPPPHTFLLNGYFNFREMTPGLRLMRYRSYPGGGGGFGTRLFEMVSRIHISFCIGS